MGTSSARSTATLGFISVEAIEGLGFCGGLLIVSSLGRPIEFHCSAPVAPNRAQEILYGRTYDHYLYCEQIGLSLIDQAKSKPQLYLANCGPLLDLRESVPVPVVVVSGQEEEADLDALGLASRVEVGEVGSFSAEGGTVWYSRRDQDYLNSVKTAVRAFEMRLPLDEPFERIHKAIDEAQAVAR